MSLRTELPVYVPEEREDRLQSGSRLKTDQISYVPEGWTADQVLNGEVRKAFAEVNESEHLEKPHFEAPKKRGKK